MTEPLNRAALEAGTAAIIGHQKARKPWICGYEDMDETGREPLHEQFEVGVRAYLAAAPTERVDVAQHLAEALRLTVEYVGTATLPALPGWSWYDALTAHYPAMAEELSKPQYRGMPFHRFPKPATTEAELDGLPMFAMVLGHDGFHHVKLRNGAWRLIVDGDTAPHRTREIALPATILHIPEGNK